MRDCILSGDRITVVAGAASAVAARPARFPAFQAAIQQRGTLAEAGGIQCQDDARRPRDAFSLAIDDHT